MAGPFNEIQPTLATRFRRLVHRDPVEEAILDINNQLARSGVRALTAASLERTRATYRVQASDLQSRLERFYRDYLLYCLEDAHLSDAEIEDLAHLRTTLGLAGEVVDAIHRTVTRTVYSRSVEQVLIDGAIDDHERLFLARIRSEFGLPDEIAANIEELKERQWRRRHPPV